MNRNYTTLHKWLIFQKFIEAHNANFFINKNYMHEWHLSLFFNIVIYKSKLFHCAPETSKVERETFLQSVRFKISMITISKWSLS